MEKISKVKEWILINYRKKDILNIFDDLGISDYINLYLLNYHHDEWIIDEISLNIDKKFDLNENEMKEIMFFIEKYVKIIISEFNSDTNKPHNNKKNIFNNKKNIVNFY